MLDKTAKFSLKYNEIICLIKAFGFMKENHSKFADVLYSITKNELTIIIDILESRITQPNNNEEILVSFDEGSWVYFFGAMCALNASIPLDPDQYAFLDELKEKCSEIDDLISGPLPISVTCRKHVESAEMRKQFQVEDLSEELTQVCLSLGHFEFLLISRMLLAGESVDPAISDLSIHDVKHLEALFSKARKGPAGYCVNMGMWELFELSRVVDAVNVTAHFNGDAFLIENEDSLEGVAVRLVEINRAKYERWANTSKEEKPGTLH